MKKIILLAGAAMIISACTEDKDFQYSGYPAIGLTSSGTTLLATPNEQSVELTVAQTGIMGYAEKPAIEVRIMVEWTDTVIIHRSKLEVMVDGVSTPLPADDTKTYLTLNIAQGESSVKFKVKAKSTQVMRGSDEAKLYVAIVGATGPPLSYAGSVTLSIKGSSPLAAAPSFAMLLGRKRSANADGTGDAQPDTLYFGINKDYYADAPAIDKYEVKVRKNSDSWTEKNASDGKFLKGNDKLGVILAANERDGWAAGDTISVRVSIAAQNEGNSIADTLLTKFFVSADKLGSKSDYDFKNDGKYWALLAGKELTAAQAKDAKKTDVVFFIDTTPTRADSAFVLKMFKSDSCKAAIVSHDTINAGKFEAALRTHSGAQDIAYGTTADSAAIPSKAADAQGVSVSGYAYYAVKITYGTGSKPKTYYGYLRLRTYMVGSVGDTHKFSRVEMKFIYGEARDYRKE